MQKIALIEKLHFWLSVRTQPEFEQYFPHILNELAITLCR